MRKRLFGAVLWLIAALLYSPAAAAQSSPLPRPWQSTDVGDVGTPGSAAQSDDGSLVVMGAGSDIWASVDSFHFVYQPIRDGFMTAHVSGETNTDPFAKTGIMIRQSLDPDSPHILLDVKPDGGLELMMRSTRGGETVFIAGASVPVVAQADGSVSMNIVLSFSRTGDTINAGYCVNDSGGGGFCTGIGPARIQFPAGLALAGVAVTSHDPSRLNRAVFGGAMPAVHALPGDWLPFDVGDVGINGVATWDEASKTFIVTGAGSDIWDTADSFSAAMQWVNADTSLTARVVDMENTHPYAKAGIEIGEPTPSAPRVVLDVKPDGGIELMARTSAGAAMAFVAGASASFPVWLRITRVGGEFQGQFSSDGQAWTTVGSIAVSLASTVHAGLVVTSHDPTVTNTAHFDNVSTTASPRPEGNLLVNPGFEESSIPDLSPGWVSDAGRQTPAHATTVSPHGGSKHGACETTEPLDCGIYQELIAPGNGTYFFTVYIASDKPGVLMGLNVNGETKGVPRLVSQGDYTQYAIPVSVRIGDTIRVWVYSPAAPGRVWVDDAAFVLYTGPQ